MGYPHMFRMDNTETKTTSSSYGDFYEKRKLPHVSLDAETAELLKYVDDVRSTYVDDLKKAVEIPSVSGVFKHRDDVNTMIHFVERWFKKLKIKYERFDIGWQKIDGLSCKLPNVLLGSLGREPRKRTLCIYSHIDVSSPESETWDTDPFELTESNKTLYGKGVSYGKGPLMCWFHSILAYQKHKYELPVNLKFIIEAMHNHNSQGLEELLKKVKPKFLNNIDFVALCASEWLAQKYPCMVHGTAGTCRFEIIVEKNNDSDPKEDMENLFSTIVDSDNKIIIPHYFQHVEQITPAEEKIYDQIDFNFEEIKPTLPKNKRHWDKVQMLMSFWRLPDIVVGDIETCTCDKQDMNTLKRCMTLKVVPKQTPDTVAEIVTNHVYHTCKEMKCGSKVTCEMVYAARPWLVDFRKPSYEALRRATVQVYKEEPNIIREDKELPELLLLLRAIDRDTILIALPNAGSGATLHDGNENIAMRNYIEGTKLLIAFLKQISTVH